MAQAIRIHRFGGPEVMQLEEVAPGDPGPGEVRLRHRAISVHFADILIRQGVYFLKPDLPATMGLEGVGAITALGPDVTGWRVGDRVAYTFALGSYATERLVPARMLVRVPDAVSDVDASAGFLRGMTAQYLLRQARNVQAGDVVLVHAAAGGMGQLLCQWARHLGATVIGTVGSADKAQIAADRGCAHVINYTTEDFATRVTEITGGKGVNVVYDSVGRDVYAGNIAVLAPLGSYVNYGHASGLLPPIDAMDLNRKSLIFTKTSL